MLLLLLLLPLLLPLLLLSYSTPAAAVAAAAADYIWGDTFMYQQGWDEVLFNGKVDITFVSRHHLNYHIFPALRMLPS